MQNKIRIRKRLYRNLYSVQSFIAQIIFPFEDDGNLYKNYEEIIACADQIQLDHLRFCRYIRIVGFGFIGLLFRKKYTYIFDTIFIKLVNDPDVQSQDRQVNHSLRIQDVFQDGH